MAFPVEIWLKELTPFFQTFNFLTILKIFFGISIESIIEKFAVLNPYVIINSQKNHHQIESAGENIMDEVGRS